MSGNFTDTEKLFALGGSTALVASFTAAGNSVFIAATATALPFVAGTVAIVGTAYAAGEYFKNNR
jgi:hypothetical protein